MAPKATPTSLIISLASLLGLDEETIRTQIWPILSQMKTAREVREYLENLLGTTDPSSTSFVSSYVSARFPTAAAPAPVRSQPPSTTSRAPSSASQPAPNRGTMTTDQRLALEREFNGGGGRIYVKEQEQAGGANRGGSRMGSGSNTPALAGAGVKGQHSTSGTTSLPGAGAGVGTSTKKAKARFGSTPFDALAPSSNPTTTTKGKGKNAPHNGLCDTEFLSLLSPSATAELTALDRSLRVLSPSTSSLPECFCQGRLHPLSPYTPLCPSCALILCSLNSPLRPCPSCSFSPLVALPKIEELLSDLVIRKNVVLTRERARIERDKEEEELARRAVRFPELGVAPGGGGGGGSGLGTRAYSNVAGAFGSEALSERIEMAYQEGRSLNGAPFGKEVSKAAGGGTGKVLRLDGKSKKVLVVTKEKRVKKEVTRGKVWRGAEVEEEERDEGEQGWLDENDDGIQSKISGKKNKEQEEGGDPVARIFFNATWEEAERPTWVELVVEEEVEEVHLESKEEQKGSVPGAGKSGGGKRKKSKGGALKVGSLSAV